MKISTTTTTTTATIAAFLSIAGTTCGVNAGAMTALTNTMSRLQVQERRRHLEDAESPCEEEETAMFTCAAANADVCPEVDMVSRKLGRESRTGSTYSSSNGLHGRHLEDFLDCGDYQSDICVGVSLYPSCPCTEEYLASEKCYAADEGLFCDDLSFDVCGDIPCIQEREVSFRCLSDNAESCALFLGDDRRRRRLEQEGDLTCEIIYEEDLCYVIEYFSDCPCADEYYAESLCEQKENGLDCAAPTQEICDALLPCGQEEGLMYQCMLDNEELCYSALFEDEPERGRHLEDMGDEPSCESLLQGQCYMTAAIPDCPCSDEISAQSACQVEANGLDCTAPTQETCDALFPCLQEDVLISQCMQDNAELCSMVLFEDDPERRRHLEDLGDEPSCEDFALQTCLLPVFFSPDCPCSDEISAQSACQVEANECTAPTQETCDAYTCGFLCFASAQCFDSVGYCSYDEESKLWSGDYEECNEGATDCAECFPDAQCDPDGDPCAPCAIAEPCFDGSGYCSYDKENALWSGDYEECNGGAAACAECFPEAQCDLDGLCAQCAIAAPCFDSTGYCLYDEESKLWSGDYEECNGGAVACAECFPDAECTDSSTAVPSSSPSESSADSSTAVPSFSPSAAPSSSPSESSAGVTSFKSLSTFMIVTVVSACILFM